MKGNRWSLLWLGLICLVGSAIADTLKLKENFPEVYIVQKGDTLWDISELYLDSPWLWPRLWQHNPQIENPHLIYPGDRLSLVWVDGQPRLTRKRMVKVSPQIRVEGKQKPIPTVPLSTIAAFLSRDHVADDDTLANAPYVLGDNDAQTRIAQGRTMYTRGSLNVGQYYGLYRPAGKYIDPETGDELGRSLKYLAVGIAKKRHSDDITEFEIVQLEQEIQLGDILLPLPDQDRLPVYFTPQPKELADAGYVIATTRDTAVFSKYDVIVINKGAQDNLAPGDMFALAQPGKLVVDKKKRKTYEEQANHYDRLFGDDDSKVFLPNEKVGEIMVFKVYDKLSFAIVSDSKIVMRPGFLVESL